LESVTVQDVSYLSAGKGRVPGFLVPPGGEGPFAGIVYMHWGGDRTEFLSEAVLLAKKGAVSLMIDAPYHRPTSNPTNSSPIRRRSGRVTSSGTGLRGLLEETRTTRLRGTLPAPPSPASETPSASAAAEAAGAAAGAE
jgi:hypothetical protein